MSSFSVGTDQDFLFESDVFGPDLSETLSINGGINLMRLPRRKKI